MHVTIEPIHLGSIDGPTVWIVIRQVGRHKDIEQAPDDVVTETDALNFASRRWKIPVFSIRINQGQIVEVDQ